MPAACRKITLLTLLSLLPPILAGCGRGDASVAAGSAGRKALPAGTSAMTDRVAAPTAEEKSGSSGRRASTRSTPGLGGSLSKADRAGLKLARRLFRSKRYEEAGRVVERLLARPGRPAETRGYLLRQRDLCRRAAGVKGGEARGRGGGGEGAKAGAVPPSDCGPRALALVCRALGVPADAAALRAKAGTTRYGTSLAGLLRAARGAGLRAEGVQMDRAALDRLDRPAVAWVDGGHYLAVLRVADGKATVHDPNEKGEEVIPTDTLLRRSGGVLMKVWN